MAFRYLKQLALLALFCPLSTAAGQGITWANNLDEARALALQQNKLLLLHFYTPSCPPCRIVESQVFPLPQVAQTINKDFVALKVNADEDAALRDHFQVNQWPMDVISTVGGKALHSMVTPRDASRYIQSLTAIAMQQGPNASDLPSLSAPQNTAIASSGMIATALPQLPESMAMARRPGVDLSTNSAVQPPLGGPMGGSPSFAQQQPGFVQQQPGFAQQQPGFAQQQPGFAQQQPGFAQQQPGFVQQQPRTQIANRGPTAVAKPSPQLVTRVQPQTVQNRYAQAQQQQLAPSQGQVVPGQTAPAQNVPSQTGPSQFAQTAPPQHMQNKMPRIGDNRQFQQPAGTPGASQPNGGLAMNAMGPTLGPASGQQPSVGQTTPPGSQQPAAPQQQFGLDGRCPVTLISQGKWKKGDAKWGAVHRGHTYLFAGPKEQQLFLSNPDEYSPILAGMDVVQLQGGQVAQGNRRYGVLYDDDGAGPNPSRIYLFDSVATRNRFESTPETFAAPVIQAMQSGNLNSLLR